MRHGARIRNTFTGPTDCTDFRVIQSVNLETGAYTNAIGAAQLATVWTDPSFKVNQAAVYYVRALEISTPREVFRAVRSLTNFEVQPKITIQKVLADLAE